MNNRYDINSDGENNLLIALREQDSDAFQEMLSAEVDPFTPSKFAQCSAGLVRHFPEFPLINYHDWEFNPNGTEVFAQQKEHATAFLRHCTKDLQAYITPQISGLHLAAALNIVTVINQRQDDVNARDAWGYTPIMYALGCCNYHATTALQNISSVEFVRQGSLNLLPEHILAYGRKWLPEHIKKIIPIKEFSPVDIAIHKAVTIHQAALSGDLDALKTLLELGVSINIRSFNGSSPLLCACLNDQKEVCDYLLEHGADPYLSNYVGETPWHFLSADKKALMSETRNEAIEQFCEPLEERVNHITASTDTEPTTETAVRSAAQVTKEVKEETEVKEEKTDETVDQEESFNTQFLESALSGDFHSMVTLYFLMDKPRELAKHALNSSCSIYSEKRELITDWLKFNIIEDILEEEDLNKSYSPLLLMSKDDKDLFLNYFKNQSKINQEISKDNYLLTIAARSKLLPTFNWLLRHGATMRLDGKVLPNLRETNPIHLKQDFIESFEIFRDRRRAEISDDPKLIPDLLLYSLTTNNIEIIEDYFSDGLSLKATTKDGLSLVDIARLIDSTELESILLKRSGEEKLALVVSALHSAVSPEEEITEVGKASSSNDRADDEPQETEPDPLDWFKDASNSEFEENRADTDNFTSVSTTNASKLSCDFESEEDDALANQWFDNEVIAETQDSLPPDDSAGGDFFFTAELEGSFFASEDEASESEPETPTAVANEKADTQPADAVDIKDYLPRIKINRVEELKRSVLEEILFRLPYPKPVLRLFLSIQDNVDETLISKINNKQTLELFWMFKLYVDRKINKD